MIYNAVRLLADYPDVHVYSKRLRNTTPRQHTIAAKATGPKDIIVLSLVKSDSTLNHTSSYKVWVSYIDPTTKPFHPLILHFTTRQPCAPQTHTHKLVRHRHRKICQNCRRKPQTRHRHTTAENQHTRTAINTRARDTSANEREPARFRTETRDVKRTVAVWMTTVRSKVVPLPIRMGFAWYGTAAIRQFAGTMTVCARVCV